jgi:penicillin-binding protein 2
MSWSRPNGQLRPRPLIEPVSVVDADFVRTAGFYFRLSLLVVGALSLFALLFFRLWSLQVLQGPRYEHVARAQSFRVVRFPVPRGSILDREGRLLVGTGGRLLVTADPQTLGTVGQGERWRPNALGLARLRRLARLAHLPTWKLVLRVRRSVRRSPYTPAPVLPTVRRALAFYLEERARDFPGLRVSAVPERTYPQGALGSEYLGLLGEVSAAQLGQRRYSGTLPGQLVGQSGVEARYDRLLNGGLGRARVRVDARGRIFGHLSLLPHRRRAHTLQLTVDVRVQRAAERAILDGIRFAHLAGHKDANAGAAVVMDPWTGAVEALASYPHFNQAAAASDPAYRASLLNPRNPAVPLLDRATQGLYPAGSSFKPIVAEAALSAGVISPASILPCTGSLRVGNIVFHNVEPGINAPLDLQQALSISCDTWFYRLGTAFYARQLATGSLDMQRWARRLGLGHPTGFDVPGEAGGVVPTPGWLRRTFRDPAQRVWYEGYSVNLSIGQGYLAVTPLQLAVAYSALANGGTVVRPHVARAIIGPNGQVLRRLRFAPRARVRLTGAWAIREGLYAAAHSGTSAAVFGRFPVPVAGKTGTAETPSGSDHSWYAAWAPAWAPRVVVVVLIEHGGFGAEAAAPAAREIFSDFFRVRAPR